MERFSRIIINKNVLWKSRNTALVDFFYFYIQKFSHLNFGNFFSFLEILLASNPLLTLWGNIYSINDLPVVEPDNQQSGLEGARAGCRSGGRSLIPVYQENSIVYKSIP